MTIPGRGDLAPRRRSSYGRRRRWPRALLTLLVIAALGLGGYAGWQRWHHDDHASPVAARTPCPTPHPAAKAAPAARPLPHITAKVVNGSRSPRRAKRVAGTLRRRFDVRVSKVGNTRRLTRGASVVRYPRRLVAAARALAHDVRPHARLKKERRLHKVELVVGTRFRGVAPKPRKPTPRPSPSPSACPSS